MASCLSLLVAAGQFVSSQPRCHRTHTLCASFLPWGLPRPAKGIPREAGRRRIKPGLSEKKATNNLTFKKDQKSYKRISNNKSRTSQSLRYFLVSAELLFCSTCGQLKRFPPLKALSNLPGSGSNPLVPGITHGPPDCFCQSAGTPKQ